MCFYIVLIPISNTSGLRSSGNTRKYHQIDVYIYLCVDAYLILIDYVYKFSIIELKGKRNKV